MTNPTATSKAVEELQGLRATAKHITSWTQRDEQLVTIVRRAIDKREYRAAIDVASDITSSITRDKMLAHLGKEHKNKLLEDHVTPDQVSRS